MSDVVGQSTIVERDDLGDDDAALWEYWSGQERVAGKDEDKWHRRGRKVIKRYRDERESNGSEHRLNLLWSNVQTLRPVLYARTPKPDVVRRFLDQDDTGRLASTLLERALAYSLDQHGFDAMMEAVVEDRLLPGRGTARVMYVPHYGDELPADPDEDEQPSGEPQDKLREVVGEEVVPCYVFWEDYREGPARTWREVPWTRYRSYMTQAELTKRFGKQKAKKVTLDYSPHGEGSKEKPPPDLLKKAIVHETWDRGKGEVVWWAPSTPDLILDRMDDPLKLQGFFPSPDPVLATTTNDKRIPVPDYTEYQDQANELDNLTARIDRLTKALKVSGVYAGSEKQALQQLMDSDDNRLIAVEDWAHLQDKGGLANIIQWLPIQQVAQTLIQLYDARDRVKSLLYEITGIGDIMRGATSPVETASAQQLKANFSTRRVLPQQRQVARFARDMIRLMAGVIAGHFSADTISQITGYPQLAPVPQMGPPPPMWLPGPVQAPQPQIAGPGGPPPGMPGPSGPPPGMMGRVA